MNQTSANWFSFKNTDGLIFAILGFLSVILMTGHNGIGISPDSIVYLSVARNVIHHGAMMDYIRQPLVDFPVFYPSFLSVVGFIFGADPLQDGVYLNGFLFASVIVATGYLIDTFHIKSQWYKWIVLFSIALSPSLLEIYSMLWSETLFILLILLFMIALHSYFKSRSIWKLMLCACIAGIACITRYAGITLIATGLMLILFDPSLKPNKKLFCLCLFGSLSAGFLLANLLHNAAVTGLMTGPREAGVTSLQDNIGYYSQVIMDWLPVSNPYILISSLVMVLVFLSIVILFLRTAYLHMNSQTSAVTQRSYAAGDYIFTAYFIVYTVFIIGISTLSHFEQINNRLLSPLYIPFLISLTAWLPGCMARLRIKQRQLALVAVLFFAVIFQVNQFKNLKQEYHDYTTYGIPGYTDDTWKYSPLVAFLKTRHNVFDAGYSIYSNAHEAVYFNGALQSASVPHRNDKKDIHDFFSENGFYLIWFNQVTDHELISMAQIGKNASVIKRYMFKDGAIYFVTPHHTLKHHRII